MKYDALQIDELHKMSALMGPPTMQSWPEGVLLAAGMGFGFNAQQPIPLHLMVGCTCAYNRVQNKRKR